MGDDERGASLDESVERTLQARFGGVIERAGRLIQYQDRRVLEQGARDRQTLTLAARERLAVLGHDGRVALRPHAHEVMRLRGARGRFQFGVGGVGLADAQVLGNRAVQQARILKDHRDLGAQRGEIHRADVMTVDGDAAGRRIVGAVEQGQGGGLARARGTHQRRPCCRRVS